ncbi:MAG: phosphotransferase [bacterium]|nr:phosphotransferase [bacterium]
MTEKDFQKRIGYEGEIEPLLKEVCLSYGFGQYFSWKTLTSGYEDFNLVLETEKGKFFVKIFATFRDLDNCLRYLKIIEEVLEAGVKHPKLLGFGGDYFFQKKFDGVDIRLCVMEFINGESFYQSKSVPDKEELKILVREAAKINNIHLKPAFIYDSWAITSFPKEFEKIEKFLEKEDAQLITPLLENFARINLDTLPHCLVHGDIIKTNVIRDKKGEIFLIDFSVSNYYPRIQELAVLLCNILFDEDKLEAFPDNYKLALQEYQKVVSLTKEELEYLPLFVKIAHATHIIGATKEREFNQNTSEENDYWLHLGKVGLKYTSEAL